VAELINKSEFTQTNGGMSINTRIHSIIPDSVRANVSTFFRNGNPLGKIGFD